MNSHLDFFHSPKRSTVPFTVDAWVATVKLAWGKAVLRRRLREWSFTRRVMSMTAKERAATLVARPYVMQGESASAVSREMAARENDYNRAVEDIERALQAAEAEAYAKGAAEEREACAKIADEDADYYFGADAFVQAQKAARDIATAIRKRGTP